ncbi:MAG: hypothetical protein K9N46_04480 [Candidatus Marinimicrobia bacterium]|nr:hypothetical protein [Candidatus Neomarinimicrobiota bacterium]MCF7829356.1 hypothetical protein [Candidatus Neomarinimicrobiota bacterium]MCF7879981.1 hypothetical protein [Candidatus Neomarinimicrobiota bacterium]
MFYKNGFAEVQSSESRLQSKLVACTPSVYVPDVEYYNEHLILSAKNIIKRIGQEKLNYIDRSVDQKISKIPRFTYTQLPKEITHQFEEYTREEKHLSAEKIKQVVEQTIIPTIRSILEIKKEILARELVTETQKQQFIATKAHNYAITASQLEQVMEVSYLCIPYINYIGHSPGSNSVVSSTIRGVFVFFEIIEVDGNFTIRQIDETAKLVQGYGLYSASECEMFNQRLWECAFAEAAEEFTDNLESIVQFAPQLQHRTQVRNVQGNHIWFGLGTQEKIAVDDGFFVHEYQMTDSGRVKKNVGYIRTISVSDNTSKQYSTSEAVTVFGGPFAKGMLLRERPQHHYFVSVGYTENILSLKEFRFSTEFGEIILPETHLSDGAWNIDFGKNIGRSKNISQFFSNFGFSVSRIPQFPRLMVNSTQFYEGRAFLFSSYGGIVKKYFWRRIGFVLNGDVRYTFFHNRFNMGEDDNLLMISNSNWGATVNTGFEIITTPKTHFVLNVGYHASVSSKRWVVEYGEGIFDDESEEIDFDPTTNSVFNYTGPFASIQYLFDL